MPSINQNITHWAGDSALIEIPVYDQNGVKVSLLAASARWWMAKAVNSTGDDVYIRKSTNPAEGGGMQINLQTDVDTISIKLDPPDTEGMKPGKYYHECEVQDQNGDVSTVTVGSFTIKQALIPNEV